jgi:hypothetical protein
MLVSVCRSVHICATIGTDYREVLPGWVIGSKCGLCMQDSLLGDIGQCPHYPSQMGGTISQLVMKYCNPKNIQIYSNIQYLNIGMCASRASFSVVTRF